MTNLLQWLRQTLVLLGNLKHQLLVLAVLLLHLSHVLLESLDQVQVVVRDVVVVVLDVRKRLHAKQSLTLCSCSAFDIKAISLKDSTHNDLFVDSKQKRHGNR